jgi:RimJ/RimL family protein N-acetyltransferase
MAEAIVRDWTRRDRSSLERWPVPTEPLYWLWSYNPVQAPPTRRSWAIDADGQLVGRITLGGILEWEWLGIYLRPDRLGKGIGREALALFLDLAFGGFGLRRVRLRVAAANLRAIRCYERVGFTAETSQWFTIPDHPSLALLRGPQYHDFWLYMMGEERPPRAFYREMSISANHWEFWKASTYAPTHPIACNAAADLGA